MATSDTIPSLRLSTIVASSWSFSSTDCSCSCFTITGSLFSIDSAIGVPNVTDEDDDVAAAASACSHGCSTKVGETRMVSSSTRIRSSSDSSESRDNCLISCSQHLLFSLFSCVSKRASPTRDRRLDGYPFWSIYQKVTKKPFYCYFRNYFLICNGLWYFFIKFTS